MTTKDLFSSHAQQYAAFRPDYPPALYQFIFGQLKIFECAWDSATGNGQAAKVLAEKFKVVYGTDISEKQMENGFKASNIKYAVARSEETNFPDHTFDLITVAQAAHWFDLAKFYKEVNRVCKPGGLVAIWGYGLLQVNKSFDAALQKFYQEVVGPYWDPERKFIDEEYSSLPFPFNENETTKFQSVKLWDIAHLEGYLNTWSATQKFVKANNYNPVNEFIRTNKATFGSGVQEIKFNIFCRLGSTYGKQL